MAKLTQPDAVVTAVDRSQSETRYKCWVCVVKYCRLVRPSIDCRSLFEEGRWRHTLRIRSKIYAILPSVYNNALPKWYQELVPQYLMLACERDRPFL
jgi:hypothetical protein